MAVRPGEKGGRVKQSMGASSQTNHSENSVASGLGQGWHTPGHFRHL